MPASHQTLTWPPAVASQPARPRWWQWPTILSLDAPLVALAWQWMFARVADARLTWTDYAVQFAAVWIIYAADRWLEGWLIQPRRVRTHRHAFYQRHRWTLFAAWSGVTLAGLSLALAGLRPLEIRHGFLLLAPVVVYTLSHQFLHRNHPWRVPKEICVAVLFAAGTACFPLTAAPEAWRVLALPLAFFALLCLANCALISLWEDAVDRSHGQTSLILRHPRARRYVRLLPWVIAAAGLLAAPFLGRQAAPAVWCVILGALLLALVDLGHARQGRQLSRVLADFVLLTPALVWLLHWHV